MHNVIDFSLMPDQSLQAVCILRMLLACLCGAAVGYERKRRMKEAGLRTHILVALGSCLATIVSKYAFFDVVINESMQVDVSRIASNLLPSIAFLGAGMIFTKNGAIKGLTTAAGVWATATIGLSIGAGLYWIGMAATLMIVLIHAILKNHYDANSSATIHMRYAKDEPIPEDLKAMVEEMFGCRVMAVDAKRTETGSIHVNLEIHSKGKKNIDNLSLDLLRDPHFRGIDM